jgi:hypothetical protein
LCTGWATRTTTSASSTTRRTWKELAGVLCGGTLLLAVSMAIAGPHVLGHYVAFVRQVEGGVGSEPQNMANWRGMSALFWLDNLAVVVMLTATALLWACVRDQPRPRRFGRSAGLHAGELPHESAGSVGLPGAVLSMLETGYPSRGACSGRGCSGAAGAHDSGSGASALGMHGASVSRCARRRRMARWPE